MEILNKWIENANDTAYLLFGFVCGIAFALWFVNKWLKVTKGKGL